MTKKRDKIKDDRKTSSLAVNKEDIEPFNEVRAKEMGRRGATISQQEFLHFLISLYREATGHDVTILEGAQKKAEERKGNI